MLLVNLKSQTEKAAFISLAYMVAKADGCLGYGEKTLIDLYVEELGTSLPDCRLQQTPLINLCRCFSTEHARQIAFANLLTLAHIDGYDNETKRNILEVIQHELSINSDVAQKYESEMKIIQGSYFPDYID